MNFDVQASEPTFIVKEIVDSQLLVGELDTTGNPSKVNVNQVYLRENHLNPDTKFYDVQKQIIMPVTAKSRDADLEGLLYRSQFSLASE